MSNRQMENFAATLSDPYCEQLWFDYIIADLKIDEHTHMRETSLHLLRGHVQ